MKYWRGYLTAAILGFFSWALMEFAKTHSQLIDMVYPYVTRMVQGTLAQWSGGADYLLWQVLLVLALVIVLVTVVLMIVLRWNPIQWLGWVLTVVSLLVLLNTGLYGLNDYTGGIAADIKLNTTDYTISELEAAAEYYRDRANVLSTMVNRDQSGNVSYADFDTLADMSADGFQQLTYHDHLAVFYGTTINNEDTTNWAGWKSLPLKPLTWTDWYTSIGVTEMFTPLTGEIAINPETPAVALPFVMSKAVAQRLCISREGDAEFAAYLACNANPSLSFQYTAQLMAYISCRDALASMPGTTARDALTRLEAGVGPEVAHDAAQYSAFFTDNANPENISLVEQAETLLADMDYAIRDLFGVEPLTVESESFYDLLVSWHIQEIVLPNLLPEEEEVKFDPYDENYVNGITDIEGNLIAPEGGTAEESTSE